MHSINGCLTSTFTYYVMCLCTFCRVKELGPGSAADGKAADANSAAAAGAALSPQKSDLALLRNANVRVFCVIS